MEGSNKKEILERLKATGQISKNDSEEFSALLDNEIESKNEKVNELLLEINLFKMGVFSNS